MKLRSGRIISTPIKIIPVVKQNGSETVYDYIVRRNGIMNEVKLHLFQLTLIKNLEEQHIQIDKICSVFTKEFDYLMRYKFEPTKRFIQLIHSKTLEWMNQYPSRRDLLFKLHDMTHI
jgi:hypothetical protein